MLQHRAVLIRQLVATNLPGLFDRSQPGRDRGRSTMQQEVRGLFCCIEKSV